MAIILKIRDRGKRGYDISSVPMKKLVKLNNSRRKFWELKELNKEKWLILRTR